MTLRECDAFETCDPATRSDIEDKSSEIMVEAVESVRIPDPSHPSSLGVPGLNGELGSGSPPQNPFASIWSVDNGNNGTETNRNMTLQLQYRDTGSNNVNSYIPLPPPPSYLGNFPGHHIGVATSVTNSPTTPSELAALLNEMNLQQAQYATQQQQEELRHSPETMPTIYAGPCVNDPQHHQLFLPTSGLGSNTSPTTLMNGQPQFTPPSCPDDRNFNDNGGGNFVFGNCYPIDSGTNFQAQPNYNFENVSIPTPPWDPVCQNRPEPISVNVDNGGGYNCYGWRNEVDINGGMQNNDFRAYPPMSYPQPGFNQYENFGPSSSESMHLNNDNMWQGEHGSGFHPDQNGYNPPYYDHYYRNGNERQRRNQHQHHHGGRRRRNNNGTGNTSNANKSRQSVDNGNGSFNGNNVNGGRFNQASSNFQSSTNRGSGHGHSNQNNGNGNGHRRREADFSHYDNLDSPESAPDNAREVGIVDKLLHSYGFIRCPVSQCRLFFHFSHYVGNIEHLKQGDTVEFDKTYDNKTTKPVATGVVKLSATIMKDEGRRLSGTVTSELTRESNGKLQGRISYEYNGECFFLPYGKEDVEGGIELCVGDAVSFQIEIKNKNGGLVARFVQLECSAKTRIHNGFVTCVCEDFGFIQRVDVPKKIYYHFSEIRFSEEIEVGDYVEFNIDVNDGHEAAININKALPASICGAKNGNGDIDDQAEARLAARRQARAEAREIRMRELEKQQKESDDNADKQYDMYSTDVVNRAAFRVAIGNHRSQAHSVGSASYHSSRRSSEDSSEDGVVSLRDMRHELKELEDKFRKSMVQNAQLDNEKAALTYQVELLKDKIEDIEENMAQLQREHKDKCREYENLKRISAQLKLDLEYCKAQLLERDDLIKDYGLVVVESEVEVDIGNGERETRIKRNLVTQQSADVLSTLGTGSLDVRLKKVIEENNDLQDEIRRLKLDLEEERNHAKGGYSSHNSVNNSHAQNGPEEDFEVQREASKIVAEYKFKVQKYEQEIATLQANVARLDGQVTRYKTASEEAESREDDLKVDKRKLQRELREAQSRLDELETTNSHLQKRLDKLKTAKSTLLKEL